MALAPCSPFSVSAELLRQSAILARQYHVRLHTHLCETKEMCIRDRKKDDTQGNGDGDATAAKVKVGFITLHDENSTYDKNFIDAAKEACANLGLVENEDYFIKTLSLIHI